jgi:hypothetical protein
MISFDKTVTQKRKSIFMLSAEVSNFAPKITFHTLDYFGHPVYSLIGFFGKFSEFSESIGGIRSYELTEKMTK